MTEKPATKARTMVPAMLADTDYLFRQAKLGCDAFVQAQPFPHLLLPSFIKSNCCFALYEGLQCGGSQPNSVAGVLRMLLWELSSSTLIRHFTSLTGKPPLLPDPFLLHSGPAEFSQANVTYTAEQEFFVRHPETQLQNVLRMEVFVASEAHATFTIDLIDKRGHVAVSHIARNGSVLFVNSDNYYLRYHFGNPEQWRSLVAYYYVNDRARNLNGEEQPRATY